MRPEILYPLFQSVSSLKGVGPAMLEALMRLLARDGQPPTLRDLLFHLPSGYTDRRQLSRLSDAPLEVTVSLRLRIIKHLPAARIKGRRPPYRIQCEDETGSVLLVFFNAREDFLRRQLPEGEERLVGGVLERFDGHVQMTHPDVIAKLSEQAAVLKLEANYPLTYQLSAKKLRALVSQALARCPQLPEWLHPQTAPSRNWPGWREAMAMLHQPEQLEGLEQARARLAYDELLASQLSLAIVRQKTRKEQGIYIADAGQWRVQVVEALPFQLTHGQQQVLAEMDADFASGHRMLRLLQGDVGSGKTIVALLGALPLLERGYQLALMVPTEILGLQHQASLQALVAPLGLEVVMLSGKLSAADYKQRAAKIADGSAQIVIGTHALFQEQVSFHRLGMVIIDEQHRFGVRQRLALGQKGQAPHVLLMTATPIPRSLTMTVYGDMDSSILSEKPAHRLPIETRAMPLSRLAEVVDGLKRALSAGAKAYWICPLVEESEEPSGPAGDLAAAESRHAVLRELLGERVGLMHGRMKPDAREEAMQGFAGTRYDVLVATTVVEVGVNVPEATIIVIEHAERFGLSQLHQLRGRVGRGAAQSHCILLYKEPCGEVAQERLRIIRESNDGFRIAEEDLRLRGAGDVLGTRQSGLPDFRFVDLSAHHELMLAARDDVKWVLHHDAELKSERGTALRVLLYLFGYDASLRYLKAG